MLHQFLSDGGFLMWPLLAVLAATVFLAAYGIARSAGELLRLKRLRRKHGVVAGGELRELGPGSRHNGTLAATYFSRFADRALREDLTGASTATARLRILRDVREDLLAEVAWPADILAFLSGYAAKLGLTGTVLGLCMHFLAFGTEGTAEIASRAMGIALYTTLGALGIAVVAEPCVYLLRWNERWIGDELARWDAALAKVRRVGEGGAPKDAREAEIEQEKKLRGHAAFASRPVAWSRAGEGKSTPTSTNLASSAPDSIIVADSLRHAAQRGTGS